MNFNRKYRHFWGWELKSIEIPLETSTCVKWRTQKYWNYLGNSVICKFDEAKSLKFLRKYWHFWGWELTSIEIPFGNVDISEVENSKVLKFLWKYLHFWGWELKSIEIPQEILTCLRLRTQKYWNSFGNIDISEVENSTVLKYRRKFWHFWGWQLTSIEIP